MRIVSNEGLPVDGKLPGGNCLADARETFEHALRERRG